MHKVIGERSFHFGAIPPPPRFVPAFPHGLCWSVEVKHGDRVERTGADCTERLKKGKNSGRGHKLMLLWVQRKTLKQRRHHSLPLLLPIRFSCTILHDKKSEPGLPNATPPYYASLTQVPRKLNEWQISGLCVCVCVETSGDG